MIRLLLILFLLFIAGVFPSFCQEKFSFDFIVSSNFCYRQLANDSNTKITKFIVESRNSREKPALLYKAGIGANYHLTKSFISLGLLFSKKGYKTGFDLDSAIFPGPLDPLYDSILFQNNSSSRTVPKKFTFNYNYLYLDIPISFSYKLIDKKIKLFLTAGLQGNILIAVQNKIVNEFDDGSKTKNTSADNTKFEIINFSLQGGLGMEFKITKKLNILIEPYYERNMLTVIQAPIKEYLYSVGINAKVRYK